MEVLGRIDQISVSRICIVRKTTKTLCRAGSGEKRDLLLFDDPCSTPSSLINDAQIFVEE